MHKPIKKLGQNFLLSFDIADKMVAALELAAGDLVVEIGAGLGAVTKTLVDSAEKKDVAITAVEIDERFIEQLKKRFSYYEKFAVYNADILSWLPDFKPATPFKILGSLPYYITSPILHKIVRRHGEIQTAVLLIQKEVANKILSDSPDASYLSVYIRTFFEVEKVVQVQRANFDPAPNVDSTVIKLTKKPKVIIDQAELENYEAFLHTAFSKPRKMLNKVFDKEFLHKAGFDDKLRPQHVSAEQWQQIYLEFRSLEN